MNPFESIANSSGKSAEWLIFFTMILAIGLAVGIVLIWAVVYRPKAQKRKRKLRKRHHRQHNPTLAQTGGLPPRRDPDSSPPNLL